MTKRNPEFGGFSACFAVRAETDRKGKATPPARTETAILHKKTNNSSSHFHKQIISHPPQITANHPCTLANPFSLCKFSGANLPVNPCLLQVRTKLFETSLPPAARSEYQRLFHFNPFTHPNMFNLCSVFISQVVKSKAVSLLINDICQYGF